jgi:hypothetical protein
MRRREVVKRKSRQQKRGAGRFGNTFVLKGLGEARACPKEIGKVRAAVFLRRVWLMGLKSVKIEEL